MQSRAFKEEINTMAAQEIEASFEEAIAKVRKELKKEGFGD